MAEIIAFVSGCVFSLLLTGGCIYLSYKVLEYRLDIDIRREEKIKTIKRKNSPIPSGGVIKPKTIQELEDEKNEELKAFADILNGPDKE